MSRKRLGWVCAGSAAALMLVSGLALAQQDDAKNKKPQELVRMMQENHRTLIGAIEAAEKSSGGKAINAAAVAPKGELRFMVTCVTGDKREEVTVDGKTGEVIAKDQVRDRNKDKEKDKAKKDATPPTGGRPVSP